MCVCVGGGGGGLWKTWSCTYLDVGVWMVINCMKFMGLASRFSAIRTKTGNFCNFLFASMDDKALQSFFLLIQRICSLDNKLMSSRVDPHYDGRQK